MYGDKLITLAVTDQIASSVIDVATGRPLKSLVTNTGKLAANGGRVELTAAAARAVVNSVINNTRRDRGELDRPHNGMVVLSAATKRRRGADPDHEALRQSLGCRQEGRHHGRHHGGDRREHRSGGAKIDASGQAGGGKVLIGGNPDGSRSATTVSIDKGTTINASAIREGNGGKISVWSEQETTFFGTAVARGGWRGGDGGFIETASAQQLTFDGTVDMGARRGSAGTLLLEAASLSVVRGCEFDCKYNSESEDGSTVTSTALDKALASGNVILKTTGGSGRGEEVGAVTSPSMPVWCGAATIR